MKKTVVIIFLLVSSLFAFAQSESEHLKFMGIELDDTITEFQKKIEAKGCVLDPITNKLPNGIRMFNGTFSGEKASIFVYYNQQSKIVYRAKVVIERNDKDLIEQLMSKFENRLDMKYGTDIKNTTLDEIDYFNKFDQHLYRLNNGEIGLFICLEKKYSYQYSLHIDYKDAANSLMNYILEMDDL